MFSQLVLWHYFIVMKQSLNPISPKNTLKSSLFSPDEFLSDNVEFVETFPFLFENGHPEGSR